MQWRSVFKPRSLVVLLALQIAVSFPFRFTTELGERDSYRMFLGVMDTLKTGSLFNSSLLYNREASFGYYALLYALTSFIGHNPLVVISTMNWIGMLSAILFLIPFYVVTERLFGTSVAIASGVILIATPVWWHCSLYGHPEITSLTLFFFGLAILSRFATDPPLLARVGALLLFAVALTFRLDAALLFVALIAVLAYKRQQRSIDLVKESAFYIVGALILFVVAKHFLPPVQHGTPPPSIFDLLARFETTSDLHASIRDAVVSMGMGFTGILLVAVVIATCVLFRQRQYALLLFVSGEILVNVVFFFLDPMPPRHYLFMTPAVAIAGGFAVSNWLLKRFSGEPRYIAAVGGAVLGVVIVLTSLSLNYGTGYLGYFRSQFTDRLVIGQEGREAYDVAQELTHLRPLGTPVVVLCDSNLVVAEMEKLAPDTSAVFKMLRANSLFIGFHEVHEGQNEFIMVEQSWEPSMVQAFDETGAFAGIPVLTAPALKIDYEGSRPRLAI